MATSIDDAEVRQLLSDAQRGKLAKPPFASPIDWRDTWIYFVFIDRFNRHDGLPPLSTLNAPPVAWNAPYGFRQGGSLNGVREQVPYLAALGVPTIWISPVLKNARPPEWSGNYHGYGAQDFLNVDERMASDGTRATAEAELRALVDEAHAKGIHVVLDIVLNHAARVFDYVQPDGSTAVTLSDAGIMNAPLGREPSIEWLNGLGAPRPDWRDALPKTGLSPDDAVWPSELQRADLFRRRGSKLTDTPPPGGFVKGDFDVMRQLVVEYDADAAGDAALRAARGRFPVLDVLVKAYSYLMARYDFDGFRIDSVKYVDPRMVESFGNAMREFAFSIGKKNFFTFGEIYDGEQTIAEFVGRNSGDTEGYGIDAALDFPLFFQLGNVVKGLAPVEQIAQVFDARKKVEADLLSSHGEAGQFFVSFLDNHDQSQRIRAPGTPTEQVTMALALLFTLQGIPCVYYGTEQDLEGTTPPAQYEGVREALWGKAAAFDQTGATFTSLKQLASLRAGDAALRFGRLYFRETAGDGVNFGRPKGPNGIVAYSRILAGREVLIVANCQGDAAAAPWRGFVLLDRDLNRAPQRYSVAYSNRGTGGGGDSLVIPNAVLWDAANQPGTPAPVAAAFVILAPREVQILTT